MNKHQEPPTVLSQNDLVKVNSMRKMGAIETGVASRLYLVYVFFVRVILLCYAIVGRMGLRVTSGSGLITRTLKFPFEFRALGSKWFFDPTIGTGYGFILGWHWNEPETIAVVDSLLNDVDGCLVIDIGAHLGEYAVTLASRPSVKALYAYEPIPPFAECLTRSLKMNMHTNVVVRDIALGNIRSEETIVYEIDAPTGAKISDSPTSRSSRMVFRTEVTTLDDEYSTIFNHLELPILIIVDVEGFELRVLQGARQVLVKRPIVIFEFNATSKASFSLEDIANEFGGDYEIFAIDRGGSLGKNFDNSWNCIALPRTGAWSKIQAVQERRDKR